MQLHYGHFIQITFNFDYTEEGRRAGWWKSVEPVLKNQILRIVDQEAGCAFVHGYRFGVVTLNICVAAGESSEEVLQCIQEAVEFHMPGLEEEGRHIPMPHSLSYQKHD